MRPGCEPGPDPVETALGNSCAGRGRCARATQSIPRIGASGANNLAATVGAQAKTDSARYHESMDPRVDRTTVIVGAGIAGLACARALAAQGRPPVVLERSPGVGGRCATRRVDGQPVDHGAPFLHGSDPAFLEAARSAGPQALLEGWPRRVEGEGPPCLPKAFEPREERLAYASGMTAFPKALARGIDVRLGFPVESITPADGRVVLRSTAGEEMASDDVVLALPVAASRRLLAPWVGQGRETAAVLRLLESIGAQSCLTVIAGYGRDVLPDWDILYPQGSAAVQAVAHDSAKRRAPASLVLVIQARPCWSLQRVDGDPASWASELLVEAALVLGPWARDPVWSQAHRWRYARADRGSELSRPLAVRPPGGRRVIVTGESFGPGGGIEAAWLAGNAAAMRLLEEE